MQGSGIERVVMNWVAFSLEEEEATATIWWAMSEASRALGSLRRSRTNAGGGIVRGIGSLIWFALILRVEGMVRVEAYCLRSSQWL